MDTEAELKSCFGQPSADAQLRTSHDQLEDLRTKGGGRVRICAIVNLLYFQARLGCVARLP